MTELMLMCGVPGSGKSTYIKQLTIEHGLQPGMPPSYVVSRDAIRFSLLEEGDEYFSKEEQVEKIFFDTINQYLAEGKDVIVDATHLTPKSRKKVLNHLTVKPDLLTAFYIDASLETCLAQNEQRTGRAFVPRGVIRRMYQQFIKPTYDEGFDYIFRVSNGRREVVAYE